MPQAGTEYPGSSHCKAECDSGDKPHNQTELDPHKMFTESAT